MIVISIAALTFGLTAIALAGEKVVVSDSAGDGPYASSEIVETTAKASKKKAIFTITFADANNNSKIQSSIRLKAKPGGKHYLDTTNFDGGQKPKFWRAYSYAKSKIAKRGDTVVFKAKLSAIGSPEKILWQAVSGDNTGTDYAPSRSKFAKLKVG